MLLGMRCQAGGQRCGSSSPIWAGTTGIDIERTAFMMPDIQNRRRCTALSRSVPCNAELGVLR